MRLHRERAGKRNQEVVREFEVAKTVKQFWLTFRVSSRAASWEENHRAHTEESSRTSRYGDGSTSVSPDDLRDRRFSDVAPMASSVCAM